MSTQYTVFWCFFHALCMYCARRGAPKSIVSGSLCSLSIRIHRQKEYCLSVAQILSSPVSIPNWWWTENWLHIRHDKCTGRNRPEKWHCLSKVESMRLRPEWPWRARRYKIAPDESVQYWDLFLVPLPLAMLFFHFSSDQWWQHKKCSLKIIFYCPEFNRSIILSEADSHDEEDWSVSLTLNNRWANNLVVQHQSKIFHR